ncbi:hypothetical protein C0389_04460 [bacterium]|nr:hypothetical protein [bacterium]
MKNIAFVIIFLIVATITYSQNPCPGTATVTYGNKIYHTVQIGDQCWLKENLDIGTMINGIQDQANNGVIEKYCYEDIPSNCDRYGALYSWNEAMKYSPSGSKIQGICPSGWRLPTSDEFIALAATVKSDGNALKDTTWVQGHVRGSNTSGFTALLAGTRGFGGHFSHVEVHAFFWSSTAFDNSYTYKLSLDYINSYIDLLPLGNQAAFSVRCLKGQGATDVSDNSAAKDLSTEFSLSQNYPNPFNPETTISYRLSVSSQVSLKIYDLLGREIATLVDEVKPSGIYHSHFSILNLSTGRQGSKLSSGTYYYQMKTADFVQTRKFVVMK